MKKKNIRKIVIDTETTGFNSNKIHYKNHKIIEIAAIEILNRNITKNYFHTFLKPNRKIDKEAYKIHGISNKFLKNKPTFNKIANSFYKFIKNSKLIVHNSYFDIGFINNEFNNLKKKKFKNIIKNNKIIDTLEIARKIFPRKKNNLNALCLRYKISIKNRKYHRALLDANLLAKVYLLMTTKQNSLKFKIKKKTKKFKKIKKKTTIIYANKNEINKHNQYIKNIKNNNLIKNIW